MLNIEWRVEPDTLCAAIPVYDATLNHLVSERNSKKYLKQETTRDLPVPPGPEINIRIGSCHRSQKRELYAMGTNTIFCSSVSVYSLIAAIISAMPELS